MLWFLTATIHLSRDTKQARPFPLQSDRTWITVHTHTHTDLRAVYTIPSSRVLDLLPPLSNHDLQALVHPYCPLTLWPRSSFVDGKHEKHWSRPWPPTPGATFSALRRGAQLICCRKNHAWVFTQPLLLTADHTLPAQPTCDVGDGSESWGPSKEHTPM